MEHLFKRILVIQGLAFISAGVFSTPLTSLSHDTTGNSSAKLSVRTILTEKLVSFNATYERNSVTLHWNINALNFSNHFDIERSTDGINFEKVGEARQETSALNGFYFDDNFKASLARNNDLYYRLKQTDANQQAVYSKILIVRSFNSKSVQAISVTPDPSINDIAVNVQLKQSSYVVMKVMGKDGSEILRKSTEANDGENRYELKGTNRLLPGDYTLEIIVNSNERMTLHLIKS
ncbi:MAG TPA: hypothetical protein VKR32_12645 [Puia sp.]|nr:hypothetical protein [Puia sp.]